MAQQNINIGTSANKGDGDPIRTAFTKVNANFTELFARHDGSIAHVTDIKGSVFGDDSTTLVDGLNSKINLDGTVKGNIIPDTNVAYDIGSSSLRFKDLYLSGNTIHLGTSSLSVDANGNFSFSGGLKSNNPIVGDDSTLLVDTANSTIPFTVLSDKPTTLAGYGITDGGGTTFTGTTDGITEGSTNLFFTDARVTTKLGSVSSDILPDTNVAYDIGSSSLRFKDLYLSGTTIHIGESQLSVDDDGNFDFSGSIKAQPILGDDSTLLVDTTNSKLILTNNTTADLEEDTNLYFTDARADARAQLKIDAVIDSAPGALDTLNELAAALGDDANFSTTVTNSIAAKEPTITAGTSVQYYRGDKTFQTLNTTAVAEGTNLYYTDARADARITAADTDALSEGSTNLYYTDARADARIGLANLFDLTDVASVVAGDDNKVLFYEHSSTSFKWKVDADTTYTVGDGGLTQNNLTNTLKTNYDTSYTHSQAAHAPVGAEANEFAFKTIAIDGQSDVVADTTTDTLSFEAGSNMTITTNATTDTVTFTAAGGGGGGGGDLRNYLIDGDFTQWLERTSIVLGEEGDQKFTSTLMRYEKTGDVEYTASRSTDVPTAAQSGHQSKYSLKMLNSGDNGGTVGISDYSRLTYTITGSDYASLHGGQDLILSFWVKSSMTGTYVVGFRNGQAPPERAMPMEYTISAANTWEKKNIAFTTDATGTWYFDEINAGLKIHWGLLSGDDFDGTAETWGGDGYLWATSNQVNHGATQGGTFYLSQIALYKTDTAPTNYLGDPIPLVKDKVGYYYRKSYRDFDNPGTATQIGSVVFKTNSSQTSILSTSVTFGSRMRNLGDGSQPDIKLYDNAGNSDQISYWDGGVATDNKQGDYEYHCESGFHVKTDNTTDKDGFSFHYVVDVRHAGDSGGMM